MPLNKYTSPIDRLGEDCVFWRDDIGCGYPKAEMAGRDACAGVIGAGVCFLVDREADTLIRNIETNTVDPMQAFLAAQP